MQRTEEASWLDAIKMKIALLTSNPNASLIKPLNEYFIERGIKTEIIDTNSNLSKIEGDYDLVIVRLLNPRYLYLVQFFEECGIRTLNSFRALSISSNKLLSTLMLERVGLEIPKTVFISKGEINSLKNFNFPALLKPIYGRSSRIEVLHTSGDLEKVNGDEIYLQENVGSELIRIYKIGEFYKAFSDIDGHRETTVPKKILELISRCFEKVGLEVGGIDCIKSRNKYYFVDINDMPAGIKHIENWVEIFIKYLESISRGHERVDTNPASLRN
jgi:glutathione synthase/RimK-type ligase-like ATP-grasp enzyme